MSVIPDFSCLHGRSLMVSLVSLAAGVGIWIPWIKYGYSPTLIHLAGMLTTGCIYIAFWIVGLVSLIRDSDRGYVGWKVQIASVVYLLAFLVPAGMIIIIARAMWIGI